MFGVYNLNKSYNNLSLFKTVKLTDFFKVSGHISKKIKLKMFSDIEGLKVCLYNKINGKKIYASYDLYR